MGRAAQRRGETRRATPCVDSRWSMGRTCGKDILSSVSCAMIRGCEMDGLLNDDGQAVWQPLQLNSSFSPGLNIEAVEAIWI